MIGVFLGVPSARAQTAPVIHHVVVTIAATNDEWTTTGLTIAAGDMVIVRAPGYINIGGMAGEKDASGVGRGSTVAGPNGSLEYKVGVGAGKLAGKFNLHVVEESGELKFRVRDSDYRDNKGQFEVDVVVLPPSAIPPATTRSHH